MQRRLGAIHGESLQQAFLAGPERAVGQLVEQQDGPVDGQLMMASGRLWHERSLRRGLCVLAQVVEEQARGAALVGQSSDRRVLTSEERALVTQRDAIGQCYLLQMVCTSTSLGISLIKRRAT